MTKHDLLFCNAGRRDDPLLETSQEGEKIMKIYIVTGTYGKYDDRIEWLVKAYHSKELAENHVNEANRVSNTWLAENEELQLDMFNEQPGWNLFDPENKYPTNNPEYYLQLVDCDMTKGE
jgi:protease II